MKNSFKVNPTDNRINAKGLFLAQLNPVDIINPICAGNDILVINKSNSFSFQIKARLQSCKEVLPGTICIDQKIRMAIGVDKGGTVTIAAPEWSLNIRRSISEKFFGRQVNLLRVRKATFTDMEINLCRLTDSTMKSIGIEEGDKVIVEAANKKIEIRALELSSETIASRKKKEEDSDSKYYSIKDERRVAVMRNNTLNYDLPWILLDLDARKMLGIKAYDPVMVYRSNSYAIKKNLHTTTLPMIAMIAGFIIGLDYLKQDEVSENKGLLIIQILVFVTGLFLTIWMNLLSIRKKLK